MPVIPEPKQEEYHEFQAILSCRVRSCLNKIKTQMEEKRKEGRRRESKEKKKRVKATLMAEPLFRYQKCRQGLFWPTLLMWASPAPLLQQALLTAFLAFLFPTPCLDQLSTIFHLISQKWCFLPVW